MTRPDWAGEAFDHWKPCVARMAGNGLALQRIFSVSEMMGFESDMPITFEIYGQHLTIIDWFEDVVSIFLPSPNACLEAAQGLVAPYIAANMGVWE